MKNETMLIFDFFGVISREVAPYWLRNHFDEEKSKMIKADIVGMADIGMISENEMFNRLGQLTNVPQERILAEWMSLAIIDNKVVEFIKKIKNDYIVTLLSNAPSEFLYRLINKNDLKHLFEKIVISSEVKTAKPDIYIYKVLLDSMKGKFKRVVMIDDNPLNLLGAKEAGIETILYKDFDTFLIDFSEIVDL